jgi:hypothetical protein
MIQIELDENRAIVLETALLWVIAPSADKLPDEFMQAIVDLVEEINNKRINGNDG